MDEITIYDIAKKANVSVATVSRVVNNYPYVKKDTRAKVLRLLEENNYIPNETARNLVNQSSKLIGILVADIRMALHSNISFTLDQEFSKKGYSCLIYNTGFDVAKQVSHIQDLSMKKISGVILLGSLYQSKEIEDAIAQYIPKIPVIVLNGVLNGPNCYSVCSDEKSGIIEGVKLLASKNRKHIGFVFTLGTPNDHTKRQGIIETCRFLIPDCDVFVAQVDRHPDQLELSIDEMLLTHPEVDALLFSEDYLAICYMHFLLRKGKHIPEDIALIGVNNTIYAQMSNPALTTLNNNLCECAIIAARSMHNLLEGEPVPRTIMIPTQLIERETT